MALVGLEVGAEVKVRIPAGTRRYEVLNLVTIHAQVKPAVGRQKGA